MKNAILSALAITILSISACTATAQDPFDRAIQSLQAQDQVYYQQMNAWMEQGRQQEAAYERQLRQATGDYQTPAHVLFERHNQHLRATNPQWAAQMDRNRANTQRNFNAQNQAMQSAFNEVNQMSMDSYNYRNASQDRSHNNFINNIHEQQRYVNPNTGQRFNLNYNPGYQSNGTNHFYQGNNGPMVQYDNSGFGDELEEDF